MIQKVKIYFVCAVTSLCFLFTNAQNTGIGISTPSQKLDINGKLKIGNDNAAPTAGTIRFNNALKDFEGFNGAEWKSLTASYNSSPSLTMSPVIEDIGFSVAINGNLAAIGAPGRKNASGDGAVYISRKTSNGWSEPGIILAPGVFTSLFGAALAANDNYLVVGSPSFKVSGIVRGRISLYKRSGNFYNLLAHYQAQVPVNGETFGGSLSLYGNYLAVGCRTTHAEAPATTSNNVYIFTLANDALQQQQVITNFNSPAQENFGMAVAIDSTTLAIGAPKATSFGNTERGKVYMYRYAGANTFSFANELSYAPYGNNGDNMGAALSLYKNTLAIGAPGFSIPPLNSMGAMLICTKDGSGNFLSSSLQLNTNPGDGPGENYGQTVCVYKDVLLTGSILYIHQYTFNANAWGYHRLLSSAFPNTQYFSPTAIAMHELNYVAGEGTCSCSRGRWVAGDCRY